MPKDREAQAVVARMPPRWFVILFWHAHRALLRLTRGRWGLWQPKPDRWGPYDSPRRDDARGDRDKSLSATSKKMAT
jgi:hypothetical protein